MFKITISLLLCFALIAFIIPTPQAAATDLTVEMVYPQGPQQMLDHVLVKFSHSIMDEHKPHDVPKEILRISPHVKGSLRWHDSKTMLYVFDEPVTKACGFKFTLRKGIKSLSGHSLQNTYNWSAEIIDPEKVITVIRSNNSTSDLEVEKALQPNWFVIFNKRLKPEELYNGAYFVYRLKGENGKLVSLPASLGEHDQSKKSDNTWFAYFYPRRPLPPNVEYELYLRKGRSSADAKASLKADLLLGRGETYGKLDAQISATASTFANNYFSPENSVYIKFSNPVDLLQACKHISIDSILDSEAFRQKCFLLNDGPKYGVMLNLGNLQPALTHKIEIQAGLEDIFGQVLNDSLFLDVQMAPLASRIRQTKEFGFLGKEENASLSYLISNSTDLMLSGSVLSKEASVFLLLSSEKDDSKQSKGLKFSTEIPFLIKQWDWEKAILPPSEVRLHESLLQLPIRKMFNSNDFGKMMIIKLSGSNDFEYARLKKSLGEAIEINKNAIAKDCPSDKVNAGDDESLYQKRRSHLAAEYEFMKAALKKGSYDLEQKRKSGQVKLDDLYSLIYISDLVLTYKLGAESSLVWTTRLSDGASMPHVKLELLDKKAEVVWSGATDENGLAVLPGTDTLLNYSTEGLILYAEGGEEKAWQKIYGDFQSSELEGADYSWKQYKEDFHLLPTGWRLGWLIKSSPVYCPGDAVRLKIISRSINKDQLQSIKDDKVQLSIFNPHEQLQEKVILPVSKFGSISHSFSLSQDAPQGLWPVYLSPISLVDVQGRQEYLVGYLPVFTPKKSFYEFIFNVKNEQTVVLPNAKEGENMLTLSVKPAFGWLSKDLSLVYKTHIEKIDFVIPGFQDYSTSSRLQEQIESFEEIPADYLSNKAKSDYILSGWNYAGEIRQHSEGVFLLPNPVFSKKSHSPRRYYLDVELRENGYPVACDEYAFIAHNSSLYAALKIDNLSAQNKAPLIDIFACDVMGNVVENISLTLKLYRRDLLYDCTKQDAQCLPKVKDYLLQYQQIFSTEEATKIDFGTLPPGYYWLLAELQDEQGRPNSATVDFYVGGENEKYLTSSISEENSESTQHQPKLFLFTDKENYLAGDTAKVMIKSPFDKASALISLERYGIKYAKTFNFDSPNPVIELPIAADYAPNVFLSVILLKGRTGQPPQSIDENFKRPAIEMFHKELKVTNPAERWSVLVQPKQKDFNPGEEVELKIQLHDIAGNSITSNDAELAVVVIREELSGYQKPISYDPEQFMMAPLTHSRHKVVTFSSLENIINGEDKRQGTGARPIQPIIESSQYSGIALNEKAGKEELRHSLSPLRASYVYFDPMVAVDHNGQAKIKFNLPKEQGNYKVYAIATGEGRQRGLGEYNFKIAKAVKLETILPDYVTYGDEFLLVAQVTNQGTDPGMTTVTVSGDNFNIVGEAEKKVPLEAGEKAELYFPVKAEYSTEELTLNVDAALNGSHDMQSHKLSVYPHSPLTTILHYELLKSKAGEESDKTINIKIDKNTDLSRGQISVELATGLSGLVGAYLDWLSAYDDGHDDFETSMYVNMGRLALFNLKERLSHEPQWAKGLEEQVNLQINKLDNWYHGIWTAGVSEKNFNTAEKSVFNTTLALDFLLRAKKKGLGANSEDLQMELRLFLKEILRAAEKDKLCGSQYSAEAKRAIRIYAISVLARASENVDEDIEEFYKKRDDLSLFEQAYLLQSISHQRNLEKIGERLGAISRRIVAQVSKKNGEIVSIKKMPHQPGAWFSSKRLRALLISSLCEALPGSELLDPLVDSMVNDLKRQHNYQVGDVFNILAVNDYLMLPNTVKPNMRVNAYLNSAPFAQAVFSSVLHKPISNNLKLSNFDIKAGETAKIRLETEGTGWAWVTIKLESALQHMNLQAKPSKSMEITKNFTQLTSGKKSSTKGPFRCGTLLKVDLILKVREPVSGIILEDQIPAGMKALEEIVYDDCPTVTGNNNGSEGRNFFWYKNLEFLQNKLQLYSGYLKPGTYRFSYIIRARVPGRYLDAGPRLLETGSGTDAKGAGQYIVIVPFEEN